MGCARPRDDYGAPAQPAGERSGRGFAGGSRTGQYRRGCLRARRAVPGAGAADLAPNQLLDEYSPEIFCNYHDVAPKVCADLGNNGFWLGARSPGAIAGAPGPYIYPQNLPRTNVKGGPGGRPGSWQTITRELWPAPYLVMDAGASLAPYNHLEVGSPLVVDYVWGRQLGDNTINP